LGGKITCPDIFFTFRSSFHVIGVTEDPAFRLKAAGPRHQDGGLAAASFGWRLKEDFSNF
jgi:hypothetical protein